MCRVISTFITQGAFWGLVLQLRVPGQSNRKGAAGVILTDGRREGGMERRDSSAAGSDVEHKHRPPQSKTKEKISPAMI